MPITPTTKTINDDYGNPHEYTITPHPAEEGVDILPSIMRAIGAVAGPLIDSVSGDGNDGELGLDSEIDGEMVGKAIMSLADEIARVGGATFAKTLLKYTTRKDNSGVEQKCAQAFSSIYQGNYAELAKAIAAVIEINFAPFLRRKMESEGMSKMIEWLAKHGA